MPSPFPGMDPFIESQGWKGFHTRYVAALSDLLVAQLRPRYIVQIEEYVYLAREDEEPDRLIESDLYVAEPEREASRPADRPLVAAAAATAIYTVPLPRQYRQRFLTIRNAQSRRITTVLELLSPTNKSPRGGRGEYLVKRTNIFYTEAHLVEIDLLRGGERLPTRETLAPADYHAFVCRRQDFPRVEVCSWTLRDPMPVVPVPLAAGDSDASLDLQAAFTTTYDRVGYDYALDYGLPVEPPLEASAAEWVRSVIAGRSP